MTRFFNFIGQIRNSPKRVPKLLLNLIQLDVRSITGSNFRRILLETEKLCVCELEKKDIMNIEYFPMKDEDLWKTKVISELLDYQEESLDIPSLDDAQVKNMLSYICVC